jgi:protein-S-isoprenylcysteine O-methyltransferase Ste14
MLGGALAAHRDGVTLAAVMVATAALAVRIWSEEREVLRRYPEYAEYARRTRRVVPWLL